MTSLDLTPSWKAAVTIYISVLQNPEASFAGIAAAKEELLRLAEMVDGMIQKD